MAEYRTKYMKYKSKYLSYKLQKGGNQSYEPDIPKVINIDKATTENKNYRRIIHTTDYSQLVLMRLRPGVEIGMELHENADQFIRIEKGTAKYSKNGQKIDHIDKTKNLDHTIIYDKGIPKGMVIGGEQGDLPDDHVLLVPRNTWHNIWNPSGAKYDVFIYTVYSFPYQRPPHKKDMQVQYEKEDEKYEKH